MCGRANAPRQLWIRPTRIVLLGVGVHAHGEQRRGRLRAAHHAEASLTRAAGRLQSADPGQVRHRGPPLPLQRAHLGRRHHRPARHPPHARHRPARRSLQSAHGNEISRSACRQGRRTLAAQRTVRATDGFRIGFFCCARPDHCSPRAAGAGDRARSSRRPARPRRRTPASSGWPTAPARRTTAPTRRRSR